MEWVVASSTLINGKWRGRVRLKGHKPITKWFDTKTKADRWGAATEAALRAGGQAKPVSTTTVAELAAAYRKMREKSRPIDDASTEHYTIKQWVRTMGDRAVASLLPHDLVAWAHQRRDEGAGPYTINLDISRLGTMIRYAGAGLPDVVGAARPTLTYLGLIGGGGKRERRPTRDEFDRVVDWMRANKGQVYADFVSFSAITAMRRSETTSLLWADLDHEKRLVLIRNRKDPRQKVGNDQWVPLLGSSWEIALRQPCDDERIFPIHPQTVTKYFTEACRELSIPDLHLHDLRHEGISSMFEDGFDIPEVAVVSGHRDWRHLKRYTQIKPELLHERGNRPDASPRPDSPPSADHPRK